MILPNVRASFGPEETEWVLRLLSEGEREQRREYEQALSRGGFDDLLDDQETRDKILALEGITVGPPRLVLYVLVRHALLEADVESRAVADYVTALIFEFGEEKRAHRIHQYDEREYGYLVDIMEDLTEASGRRAFLLRAHMGNFALWLSGLFPDRIVSRTDRRGGPGLDYYEELGQTGYRMAAEDPRAEERSLRDVYRNAADRFSDLRRGLNDFSDRFLFPRPSSPVDRLLRRAATSFEA